MKHHQSLVPAMLMVTSQPALAQVIGQGGGVDVSIWRVVLSLMFCLALGAGAVLLLRRHFAPGQSGLRRGTAERRIKLVDQQFLGQQRSICLVEIDGKPFAALFSPQAASLLPLDQQAASSQNPADKEAQS